MNISTDEFTALVDWMQESVRACRESAGMRIQQLEAEIAELKKSKSVTLPSVKSPGLDEVIGNLVEQALTELNKQHVSAPLILDVEAKECREFADRFIKDTDPNRDDSRDTIPVTKGYLRDLLKDKDRMNWLQFHVTNRTYPKADVWMEDSDVRNTIDKRIREEGSLDA